MTYLFPFTTCEKSIKDATIMQPEPVSATINHARI